MSLALSIFILFFSARDIIDDESCGCGPPDSSETGKYNSIPELAIFNNEVVDYKLAELSPSLDILSSPPGNSLRLFI